MATRNDLAESRAKRLPGDDRRLYESFRRLGMDPAAALAATQGRSSLASTEPTEALVETWETFFENRPPEQRRRMAEAAARGREGIPLRGVGTGPKTPTPPMAVDPEGLSGPLSREEERFRDSLTRQERELLSEAAADIAAEAGLSRTFGCDARHIAETRLLKAVHRRMRGDR
jgi:hypothetical protein